MIVRRLMWSVVVLALMLALAGSFEWAPASASRLGQTVPTFTPIPPPPTPTSPPPREPTATQPPVPTPAATPPPLLPESGQAPFSGAALLALAAITLSAAWLMRRRDSRRAG